MKIVIAGGKGQVGRILERAFTPLGHDVVLLSRIPSRAGRTAVWDGRALGDWASELDGACAVINLAGRSVNCRYTKHNLKLMMDSRVDSTRVIGLAIQHANRPPRLWLQASTATIYAHTFDRDNDEYGGVIGGSESGVPAYWKYSIDIAQAWEREQVNAVTPKTRKIALRTAMVMSPDAGGIFDVLCKLTRLGLGGSIAGGAQYISWIHEKDFVRAIQFLMDREDMCGAVNVCSPSPLPQMEFMRSLRNASKAKVGLPAAKWMIEIGAFFMRTDSELMLKSRRVTPGKLLAGGFKFEYPQWHEAAHELFSRRSVGEILR